MDKHEIIDYFNSHAQNWDGNMVRNEDIINSILDNAGVKPKSRVLDVACGTGVLFPDYMARNAASVIGIDIAPAMAEIAAKKAENETRITVLVGDAESHNFAENFDCIVIYNAFPHFPNPDNLLSNLTKHLALGGRLTVAHGMSRERLNRHHSGSAVHVSRALTSEHDLMMLLSKYIEVDTIVSDDKTLQVSGVKK